MPDRLIPHIDDLAADIRDLHDALTKFMSDQHKRNRRDRTFKVLIGILVFAVAALAIWNLVERRATEERRDRQEIEAAQDLVDRQCQAWQNRLDDHATLVDYLDGFVGMSERGQTFVVGLRSAYAESDATYAKDRGLTETRCG